MPIHAICREMVLLFELIISAWYSVYMCEGQDWNLPWRPSSVNLHAEDIRNMSMILLYLFPAKAATNVSCIWQSLSTILDSAQIILLLN